MIKRVKYSILNILGLCKYMSLERLIDDSYAIIGETDSDNVTCLEVSSIEYKHAD